ncbi:MAG: DUF3842 family protein [Candidatus Limiplasma sp.]|nr:DUF3842 family protein [Candidatus Limiplasma sp.]MEA5144659.1 DUF3842 family protein [Candidatus Limiplasma sp.]
MKVLVIDGQGGGVGKALVTALKAMYPALCVTALGTNATATAAMLRAGADQGATGESAIRYQCKTADVIIGVAGILHANALLGEISPAIAAAVSLSEAQKLLIPLERCGLLIAGVQRQPLDALIADAMAKLAALLPTAPQA